MSFTAAQLERLDSLWQRMLDHRFLRETRDGALDDATFATWMRQDYLFVEAAIPFMAVLVAKAPAAHRGPLTDAVQALYAELGLFEERAEAVGVTLRGATPSFTCHAYIQFLMSTAYGASYAEAFTVLYAAEKAYHESWKVVRGGLDPDDRWYPFVDNWAGDAFAGYVDFLAHTLEELAERAGSAERRRMAELFELAVRYEIAFWEMAVEGPAWPGLR